MQLKQAAIRTQRPLKPAVGQVKAYYLTSFHVARNTIPGTTILFFFPKLHLRIRIWLRKIIVVRISIAGTYIIIMTEVGFLKWKLLFELQQSSALVREAFECRGSGRNIWGARNIDTTTRDEDYEVKYDRGILETDALHHLRVRLRMWGRETYSETDKSALNWCYRALTFIYMVDVIVNPSNCCKWNLSLLDI